MRAPHTSSHTALSLIRRSQFRGHSTSQLQGVVLLHHQDRLSNWSSHIGQHFWTIRAATWQCSRDLARDNLPTCLPRNLRIFISLRSRLGPPIPRTFTYPKLTTLLWTCRTSALTASIRLKMPQSSRIVHPNKCRLPYQLKVFPETQMLRHVRLWRETSFRQELSGASSECR